MICDEKNQPVQYLVGSNINTTQLTIKMISWSMRNLTLFGKRY
jgi:hypothetical protein